MKIKTKNRILEALILFGAMIVSSFIGVVIFYINVVIAVHFGFIPIMTAWSCICCFIVSFVLTTLIYKYKPKWQIKEKKIEIKNKYVYSNDDDDLDFVTNFDEYGFYC